MWPFNKKKVEEEVKTRKELLKEDFIKEFKRIRKKDKIIQKIRHFFIEYFNIKYECTFVELIKEIKKKRLKEKSKKFIEEYLKILEQFHYNVESDEVSSKEKRKMKKVTLELVENHL
ncbi:MAG: hypothetical protein ACOC1K_03010 [Nanoarchaeota archaeon]